MLFKDLARTNLHLREVELSAEDNLHPHGLVDNLDFGGALVGRPVTMKTSIGRRRARRRDASR